jgi:hypothetical protein
MDIEAGHQRLSARPSLVAALAEARRRIARPGTWWTGAERVAIAAEVQLSRDCRLCHARKGALSPVHVQGRHDTHADLDSDVVEVVHRLATDAARIGESWVKARIAGPIGEERYVELVSVVAIQRALDTFDVALGRPLQPPFPAEPGEPTRRRPVGAARDLAWVATVAPEHVAPGEPNPYPLHGDKNIHRALSLVPQAVIDFFDLDVELYLKDHEIRDFGREYRAITHAQIELIAARVSAINQCFY